MPSASRHGGGSCWKRQAKLLSFAPLLVLVIQLLVWFHFQSMLRPGPAPAPCPPAAVSAAAAPAAPLAAAAREDPPVPEAAETPAAAVNAGAAGRAGAGTPGVRGLSATALPDTVITDAAAPAGAASAAAPVPSAANSDALAALKKELAAVNEERTQLTDQVAKLQGERGALQRELDLSRRQGGGSGGSTVSGPFLTLCMPTTPRGKGVDYLPLVVELLLEQIDEVTQLHRANGEHLGLKLVVMNTRPAPLGDHAAFEAARLRFQGHWSRPAFVNGSQEAWKDPNSFEPNNLKNPKQIPGHSVRHQTHDMVQLLQVCAREGAATGEHTLLVEDDFLPCPFALYETIRAIRLLPGCRPKNDWKTLSLSQGMNGIVVPRRGLANLTSYLEAQINVRPPDLLIYDFEWNQGEERMGYRYHLWEHIGDLSSFDFRRTAAFQAKMAKFRTAGCWTERTKNTMAGYKALKVKRFEDGQALPQAARQPDGTRPDVTLSPCLGGGAASDGARSLDAFLEMRHQARELNQRALPKEVAAAMKKSFAKGQQPSVPQTAVQMQAPVVARSSARKQHAPWTTLGAGVLSCSEGQEALDPPHHRGLKTLQACKDACDTTELCHSFSYHAGTDSCYLKSGCGKPPKLAPADCPAHEWQTYYYDPCNTDTAR
eukprot:TRINITY_DN27052_c1_g1_i1.p1 TRINITY_DN27052_c1_g1~~TRINITY_DN27052_c1_g1_i1.p1  ORF type:complete len:657 (-),score=159.81 TRINITY_DN27052_c1_g1_i1:99-2069(-)